MESAEEEHEASKCVKAPLLALIILQVPSIGSGVDEMKTARNRIRSLRRQQVTSAMVLNESLPGPLQRCVEIASEKGVSTWLEALPIREHGFHLSRTEFRDSISLR